MVYLCIRSDLDLAISRWMANIPGASFKVSVISRVVRFNFFPFARIGNQGASKLKFFPKLVSGHSIGNHATSKIDIMPLLVVSSFF